MNHARIDVLWTLGPLAKRSECWDLYVNYRVQYESEMLRDAFYCSNYPHLPVRGDRLLLAQVRVLTAEARAMLRPIQPIQEGGVMFNPVGQLDYLTHYPRGWWNEQQQDAHALTWTRHLELGGKCLGRPDSGQIQLADLSLGARAAVACVDSLAISTSYRRHGEQLARSSDIDLAVLPPPENARVFIAYRRGHFGAAKALHAALASYAHATAFVPYLDHHGMELGDYREQLFRQIRESDVFMPIVSEDYGALGSVSAEELRIAQATAQKRGLLDFFAPVFVADPERCPVEWLRKQHGAVISEPQIFDDSPELQRFFGTVLMSVLSR